MLNPVVYDSYFQFGMARRTRKIFDFSQSASQISVVNNRDENIQYITTTR